MVTSNIIWVYLLPSQLPPTCSERDLECEQQNSLLRHPGNLKVSCRSLQSREGPAKYMEQAEPPVQQRAEPPVHERTNTIDEEQGLNQREAGQDTKVADKPPQRVCCR